MSPEYIIGITIGVLFIVAGFIMMGIAIWKAQGGHKCRGSETGRRFVPGALETGRSIKVPAVMSEDDRYMAYGYTEISYECSTCSRPFNNRYIGKIIDPEHEWTKQ